MAERRKRWKVDETMANVASKITIDPRISAIYKDQKELVGIKEPSNVLIQWLSDKDGAMDVSKQQLKIVSIVGFGGLGKTTLVKMVYDKIKEDFDCSAFVPVGRNGDAKKILLNILCDLDTYVGLITMLDVRQLIDKLKETLENTRYVSIYVMV